CRPPRSRRPSPLWLLPSARSSSGWMRFSAPTRSARAGRSSSAISRAVASASTTCSWIRPSTSRPPRSSTCCWRCPSTGASRSTRSSCSAASRRARPSAASRSASAPSWSPCCAA
ncbi:MAG: hypothetical protein AVDCRST_MAG69-2426, partial [uncultured Solirubrobacteraceae bacterium]